jgi:peptidoglycan-N-acetylglucosamine deacetylase
VRFMMRGSVARAIDLDGTRRGVAATAKQPGKPFSRPSRFLPAALRCARARIRNVQVAGARDPFLDGLRAVSVVRVILLHLFQCVEVQFVAVFSFFMPGMPLMFFVSGALVGKSLAHADHEKRLRFWKDRARRLFPPFWAFGAVVLAVCAAGAVLRPEDPAHAFPWSSAWRWIVPLAGPQASAAFDELDWHTWFLSVLLMMIAAAPWTVALHRRLPCAGASAFLAVGAAIELARVPVPDVVRNLFLFGGCFQLGYAYADGRAQRLPRRVLVLAFAALAALAIAFHATRAPGTMLHAVPLALVTLGLAFVALWLAVKPIATRLFERGAAPRWIRSINARAYTIYLWGPVANDVARRIVAPKDAWSYALDFALALALLYGIVKLLGPIEDLAAGRGKTPALARTPEKAREVA